MVGELSSCSGCHNLFQGMDSLRESQHYQLCLVSGTLFPSISFCQTELLLLSASPQSLVSVEGVLSSHPSIPLVPFLSLAPCMGDGMGSGLFLMIRNEEFTLRLRPQSSSALCPSFPSLFQLVSLKDSPQWCQGQPHQHLPELGPPGMWDLGWRQHWRQSMAWEESLVLEI